jgi:hypothetical protein
VIERQGGIEAVLVTDSLKVITTPGLTDAVKLAGSGLSK